MTLPTSAPSFLLHYQEKPDAYWRLDHFFGGTTNLVEETGAYNAAVPGGNAATFATGFTTADGDKGLVLTGGANDYATVATFPAYASRFTAVGAFKTSTVAKQVIVGKALSASGKGWELFVNAAGKVEFKAIATSGVTVFDLVSAAVYSDNAVHLAVGVYDPVGTTAALYVDGTVVTATPATEAPDTNAALLMIGADDNGAGVGTNLFIGTLDEVALYPYCWRQGQVTALTAAKATMSNVPGLKGARSGVARSGQTRSGVFVPSVVLTINGVDQSKYLYRDSLTLIDTAGLPDTGTFTLYTLEPITGQTVLIASGSVSNRQFGGTIVRQRHRSVKQASKVQSVLLTEVTCTDWTYLLTKKLVQATYPAGMLASDAFVDVVRRFTTDGFTTHHVKTSPALTGPLTFVNTPLVDALNTLATAASTAGVAWKWNVDPYQDAWFVDVDRTAVPRALTPDNYAYEGLDFAEDLTQIRTRVYAEGLATTCPIPIPPFLAGSFFPYATFPVADASQLANAAGVVRVGTQVFPYTSTTPAGGNPNPPGSVLTFDQAPGAIALAVLDLAPFPNHGWVVINGTEYVYYDAVLGLGTSFAITSNSVANATVVTTSTPHGYVGTVIVTITGNVGSVPPINDVWIATVLSTTTFSIPCIVSTGGTGGIVQAGFNQLATIPASGYGSLGALVKKGASVTVVGYVAVAAAAVNAVTIPAGAAVVQRVQVDDAAAQTLLGAIERNAAGGATDGIHEAAITVPSGTIAACTQAAQAALTANSRTNVTGSIAASRDPLMRPLRKTLLNLPARNVDALITIQRVTRTRRGGRWATNVDFATTWRDLVAIVALRK